MKKKITKIGDKNIIWRNYMKKKKILILSLIALISTFIFAAMFCIYHFDRIPSPLTILSLISIFLTFEYFFLLLNYLVTKFAQKEKIRLSKIIGLVLPIISIVLILLFSIILNYDYLIWYAYSTPFYINVLTRSIEFLLPAIIIIIISLLLIKISKKNSKEK